MKVKGDKARNRKRIAALIGGGILFVVILPISCIYVSQLIDSCFGFPKLILQPFNFVIAAIFFAVGFFWAIWSNVDLFRKGEGTPVPMSETQTRRLVVDGAYKYTRNPMMFGYLLIMVGLGFLFNSLFLTFGVTSIFTVGLVAVIKLWEEKNLERRFGEAYVEYKKKVSFLIPMPPKKQK
ncbi:MAG: isoprenylcysteine carboxylmethyltransferase family protein [Candidatus Jordarchaeaceae archaeon]